jgi:hypothetical protein
LHCQSSGELKPESTFYSPDDPVKQAPGLSLMFVEVYHRNHQENVTKLQNHFYLSIDRSLRKNYHW